MKKNEFLGLMDKIKEVHGDKFSTSKNRMDIFFDLLKDCEFEMLKEAVNNYLANNEYPPLPANLRKEYMEIYDRERDHRQLIESIYERAYGTWPLRENEDTAPAKREFMALVFSQPKAKQKEFADHLLNRIRQYVEKAEDEKNDNIVTFYQYLADTRKGHGK